MPWAWLLAIVVLAMPITANAGYPMISDLVNQEIQINTSTPVIPFTVSDDRTSADQLVLTVRTDNTSLVPADDDHIILAGSGRNRTVQVIPLQGAWGDVNITITVTDSDGDSNRDSFEVEVQREPST